jgi:hypothetical protein
VAKALVFVLVPYSVGPSGISAHADALLKPHRMPDDRSRGRYDYLCQVGPVFDDPVTEGRLPGRQKRSLHRLVCEAERLPPEPRPHAVVTPDGTWHTCETDGVASESWPARYAELVAADPHCWVVAVRAHS